MTHPKKLRTTFDEYTVGKVIGEGATGYVLEATSGSGERVAFKYLRSASMTTDRRARFKNEVHFCFTQSHANIIRVIDHGIIEPGGLPFYVMPRYDMTLRQFLTHSRASYRQRLNVLLSVFNGVEAAHLAGVAHRDLKPENVLLSDDLSQVVVADFGIASFMEAEMATAVETRDAERLANFKYAAPEQLERPAPGDKRSDIFALGLILNEVFTGKVARGTDYRRIGEVVPEFAYLDPLVEAMTRQDPTKRIGTVGQVKDDISAWSQIAITRQKVDMLTRQVVPETELDDPLVRTPPSVSVKDWKDGQLYLTLSEPVNNTWRQIFAREWRSWPDMVSAPRMASWAGDRTFSVRVSAQDAKKIRGAYEAHVAWINDRYTEVAARAHAEKLSQERVQRQEQAKREAERLGVLDSLRS